MGPRQWTLVDISGKGFIESVSLSRGSNTLVLGLDNWDLDPSLPAYIY